MRMNIGIGTIIPDRDGALRTSPVATVQAIAKPTRRNTFARGSVRLLPALSPTAGKYHPLLGCHDALL